MSVPTRTTQHGIEQSPSSLVPVGEVGANPGLEYDPYNIESMLYELRPAIAEATLIAGEPERKSEAERRKFVAEEVPKVTPREQFIHNVVSVYEQSSGDLSPSDFTMDLLARLDVQQPGKIHDAVVEICDKKALVEVCTDNFTEVCEDIIERDGDDGAYIATKMLAAHPSDVIDDYSHVEAQNFIALGAEFEASDLFGELRHDVVEGRFDGHVARDLLYRNLREQREHKQKQTDPSLASMVAHAKYLTKCSDDHEIVALLTAPEGLATWGPETRKLLESAKKDLVIALDRRYVYRRDCAYANGILLKRATEADLERYCQNNPIKQVGRYATDRSRTAKDIAAAVNRKKRGNAKGLGGAALKQPNQVASSEVEKKPVRTLGFINTKGEVFAESSPEFKEMLHEYAKGHPGQNLLTDVTKALAYLRDPVRTNGHVRGIKAYTDRWLKNDDGSKSRVSRLRPSSGSGLSLSRRTSHKMRIVFVVDKDDSNHLLLLGVADKPNVPKLMRKYGLSPSGA